MKIATYNQQHVNYYFKYYFMTQLQLHCCDQRNSILLFPNTRGINTQKQQKACMQLLQVE